MFKIKRNKKKKKAQSDQGHQGTEPCTTSTFGPVRPSTGMVGMPALKQKRWQERNDELKRRMRENCNGLLALNDFERTGIESSQNQMKFIGKPGGPCTLQQNDRMTPPPERPGSMVNGDGGSGANAEHREVKRPVSRNDSYRADLAANKGRDLPSVKSERKASREKDVHESVIALTPTERESIMCLDNVLKEHDSFLRETSESDEVFRDEETGITTRTFHERILDESSDSDDDDDAISMDSVIDLVGDLSVISGTSSEHRPVVGATEAEKPPSPPPPVQCDERTSSETEPVYAKVNKVRKVRPHSPQAQPEPETSEEPPPPPPPPPPVQCNDRSSPEPVYAKVKKVWKRERDDPQVQPEPEEPPGEEPTAASSRMFWQRMSQDPPPPLPSRTYGPVHPKSSASSPVPRKPKKPARSSSAVTGGAASSSRPFVITSAHSQTLSLD